MEQPNRYCVKIEIRDNENDTDLVIEDFISTNKQLVISKLERACETMQDRLY